MMTVTVIYTQGTSQAVKDRNWNLFAEATLSWLWFLEELWQGFILPNCFMFYATIYSDRILNFQCFPFYASSALLMNHMRKVIRKIADINPVNKISLSPIIDMKTTETKYHLGKKHPAENYSKQTKQAMPYLYTILRFVERASSWFWFIFFSLTSSLQIKHICFRS